MRKTIRGFGQREKSGPWSFWSHFTRLSGSIDLLALSGQPTDILLIILSPLASSMMAPGLPKIADDLDIHSPTITALTLSIFLLAFALGPIVLA